MATLSTEDVLRDEAKAIHGVDLSKKKVGKELNCALNELNSGALCLSGGGIRSASFALGIMQALATHPRPSKTTHIKDAKSSWLAKFQYLSTVSGGGYIGGWLSAWLFHEHTTGGGWDAVWKALIGVRDNPADEPKQVSWLRSYSNFLTPKLGIASADSWTAIALVIRNLLLNWFVIIPILCAALLVLKLIAITVAWISQIDARYCDNLSLGLVVVGCLCLVLALRFATRQRPTRGPSQAAQGQFLRWDIIPAALAAVFFTFAVASACAEVFTQSKLISNGHLLISGLLSMMGFGAAVYAVG